jgi:plastocyanin
VTLGPHAGTQINRIFDVVGQAGMTTTNAFAVVTANSSSADLFTYAAVIDNATADSSFVSGEEDVPAPASPGPSSERIDVSLSNYMYSPGTSSPIQATAGTATTLFFESGQGSHGFSGIPALGIQGSNNITTADEGDGYGSPGHPAATYTVTFTAPASARGQTYEFWCTVHPTTMRGTLHIN